MTISDVIFGLKATAGGGTACLIGLPGILRSGHITVRIQRATDDRREIPAAAAVALLVAPPMLSKRQNL